MRRADRILQHSGTGRNHRLPQLPCAWPAAPLRESGRHTLQRFLATTEPVSGRAGHCLSRAIVYGGTESAGHDDHLGSRHGCVNGRDDILPVITDNRFESNGDPELTEFVGKEERVGIGTAPE